MIRYTSCPVCHSRHIQKAVTASDHTVSGESFEIWQCASCSLRFTQNVPGEEEINRYYESEKYISHSETRKGLINALYLQVRKITMRMKRRFIERISGLRKGRLLDVGAGTGTFLGCMRKAGWQVEGVEPNEQAIKTAAAMHGLSLKPSEHLYDLEPGSFDVITLWHVLEHVHDLHEYIGQLKKLCKPDGKIVIAVPNYTSADAEWYGGYWAAYDVPRHLYHFSPASMNVLVQKHGCRVEGLYPMWFDSFYVCLLSEQYRKAPFPLLKGIWNGLRSNSRAFSHTRRASSVIYVIGAEKAGLPETDIQQG